MSNARKTKCICTQAHLAEGIVSILVKIPKAAIQIYKLKAVNVKQVCCLLHYRYFLAIFTPQQELLKAEGY